MCFINTLSVDSLTSCLLYFEKQAKIIIISLLIIRMNPYYLFILKNESLLENVNASQAKTIIKTKRK